MSNNYVKNYDIEHGLLIRTNNNIKRLVIPDKLKQSVTKLCHDDMCGAHLGIKNTLNKITNKFFWKVMEEQMYNWCKSCSSCAGRNRPKPTRAEQHPTKPLKEPI
jgi:hypothetical protein